MREGRAARRFGPPVVFAVRRLAVALLACAILAPLSSCGDAGLGPWMPIAARQVSVPLARGITVVEIRDRGAGWSERVEVESSDGTTVTGGVDEERIPRVDRPRLSPSDVAYWRAQAVGGATRGTAIERAFALCGWVVERTYGRKEETRPEGGRAPEVLVGQSGRAVLEDVDKGGKFTCYSVATILHDLATANSLVSRRVDLGVRHQSPYEAHSVVEVWSPEEERWAVVDPTFDCMYVMNGRPAGALEIHDAVVSGRIGEVAPRRRAGSSAPDPLAYRINPLLFFRNVYVILPSGHWLTRVDGATPPPPVASPSHLLASTDEPFLTGGDPLDLVEVRRGARGSRMAFQVSGGRLYVCAAEPASSSGGLEARATAGLEIAQHPDPPPHDPSDGVLLRPIELLTDPAFATLGESARSWRVSGDLSVGRSGDVVEIEAGSEPGEVAGDTVPVLDVPYVAFLDVEVSSGEVRFGFDGPGKSLVVVPPGPARRVSTRIVAPRSAAAVTIRLAPGASCRVTKASLLRGKMLHEVLGLDDPLEGRREGSRVPDVRHVPFDPFRGGRR